jgi:transcriptional regulator with XRE-family HTH domain
MDETFGQALRRLRSQRALSQDNLGRRAHITGGYVSELELGKKDPNLDLAARLDEATNAGGELVRIAEQVAAEANATWPAPAERVDAFIGPEPAPVDARVAHSQDEWRTTRRALNAHRSTLTRAVTQVYPAANRVGTTGLVAPPAWIPDAPIPLDAVTLTYDPTPPAPALDGTERDSTHVRPLATITRPYQRYTQAIRDLDHPRLFENRATWRLLDVACDGDAAALRFGPTSFFAAVDVSETLSHEVAYVHLNDGGRPLPGAPHLRDLPYRRLVGDPFDTRRRPIITAVSTLTIRAGTPPTFILHRRDPRSVAMAGGMLQVIPSGIFQPSSVLPAAVESDFDLWRNIQREYAEELLGQSEHDGDGQPISYNVEPFAGMDEARRQGLVRVHCLGVALDALTLVGEILTVAVIDPAVFDVWAADFVEVNDEGTVVAQRLPFVERVVAGLIASGRIAPAGAGCLHLAWQHREQLL